MPSIDRVPRDNNATQGGVGSTGGGGDTGFRHKARWGKRRMRHEDGEGKKNEEDDVDGTKGWGGRVTGSRPRRDSC